MVRFDQNADAAPGKTFLTRAMQTRHPEASLPIPYAKNKNPRCLDRGDCTRCDRIRLNLVESSASLTVDPFGAGSFAIANGAVSPTITVPDRLGVSLAHKSAFGITFPHSSSRGVAFSHSARRQ